MADLLIYLVPRKYRSIGHILVSFGGFMIIIFGMIFAYIYYLSILGHCCLIIGLSGIYFSKTKNFRSVRKSEEKEGIEQKSLNGINGKALPPKYVYVFYVITIVGIIFILMFQIPYEWRFIQEWMDFDGSLHLENLLSSITYIYLIGYLPLIGGLLILFFKKRKEYWYKLVDLPMGQRLTKRLKCKDCGNKFNSKTMQCPNCNGKDLKLLWDSR